MSPLLQELSNLEAEALEIVVNAPASEQDDRLDTLTAQGNVEIIAIWKGTIPVNNCCCCCCPSCCCC